jgi:hypothetical protein
MDRDDAIASLPSMYAVAQRLRDNGADQHTIAVAVGIDDNEVPALLELASAKLARILGSENT